MVEKETVGVRLPQDKVDRIEKLAEEKNITKSDATRRLIDKGIEFNDSGIETLVTETSDSQTESDRQPIADGGTIVRDVLNLMSALYATLTLSIFVGVGVSAVMDIPLPFANTLLSWIIALSLLTAVVTVPLYTDLPEKADKLLYSGISHVPVIGKVVA
jgi:hypothetical protein